MVLFILIVIESVSSTTIKLVSILYLHYLCAKRNKKRWNLFVADILRIGKKNKIKKKRTKLFHSRREQKTHARDEMWMFIRPCSTYWIILQRYEFY